jgi:hypothetical protein
MMVVISPPKTLYGNGVVDDVNEGDPTKKSNLGSMLQDRYEAGKDIFLRICGNHH